MKSSHAILATGATGYLGGLVAKTLLANESATLVLPVRGGHSRERLLASIKSEFEASGLEMTRDHHERLVVILLPPNDQLDQLLPLLRKHNVTEIVHCAGCVDYFDTKRLREGNIELTKGMLKLGHQLNVKRFVYLSTAFSCGYVDGTISESLHDRPSGDPTDYTWSKREAEAIVATNGLPYLILRPSIVIGDSHDGRYHGKPSGMYQLWCAIERFLCDRYLPIVHVVAPKQRLPLLHQDAFLAGFLAAYQRSPDNSILHLVSREDTLPTVRQLWDLWIERCIRPREAHYLNRIADVPWESLDRRIKALTQFTAINLEIAAHSWCFETAGLDRLRGLGLSFKDATLDTVGVCFDRFLRQSKRIQSYLSEYCNELAPQPLKIESLPDAGV